MSRMYIVWLHSVNGPGAGSRPTMTVGIGCVRLKSLDDQDVGVAGSCMSETMAGRVSPQEGSNGRRPLVAIVGGGITGLAAAHRLGELVSGARVVVLEAGPR